jgi:HlyD family secretion protein
VETIREQVNEVKATLNRIVKTGSEQTNEAKATLVSKAEVRPIDVQEAQAKVDSAIAAVERTQADLDLAYVRVPIDGQILKIHTRPGEVVGDEGIADLGRTNQMYAVAEVYETDVGKVRLGQQTTITSKAFVGKLQGTVAQIGLQIDKKDVLDTDPAADVDARVVEVKIRLDPEDSKLVAGLTSLQVKVAIDI